MSYEGETLRRRLTEQIRRKAQQAGVIRSGDVRAPSGRNSEPAEDITGYGMLGFAWTGGDDGGFNTNPEGT